jgi:NAD(P)-dependent dehydrogenase (short-subunit alcohol dehydrogenase family)
MSLDRVAVVTGAGSGIGAASARRLAADGFMVWCLDLRLEAAEDSASSIENAAAQAVDVGDEASVSEAFDTILRSAGAIDVLVNSAGIIVNSRFDETAVRDWERTYRINVIGTYLCMVAALPGLRAAASPSRIVNIASAAGKLPGMYTVSYNASKAAVISLTRSAAVALAPDILVNSVCPGVIDTPMWDQQRVGLARIGAGPGTTFEERVAALPIKRPGSAEDVAEVVAFLAGPGGSYILGEDINVNGGLALH